MTTYMQRDVEVLFTKEPIAVTTEFVSSADAFSELTNQFDIFSTFMGHTSMARQFPAAKTSTCMTTTEKISTYGTAEIMNVKNIGIGSDLCLNQPDEVVEWMRNGTWTKSKNYGEGSKNKPGFPKQPNWFEDARGFKNLEAGLKKVGFSETETNGILGNNWYNFYKTI